MHTAPEPLALPAVLQWHRPPQIGERVRVRFGSEFSTDLLRIHAELEVTSEDGGQYTGEVVALHERADTRLLRLGQPITFRREHVKWCCAC